MKTGIIGCGNLAHIHLKKIKLLFPSHDIALVDIDPIRLKQFADTYHIEKTFTSIQDLNSEFNPDFVHIVTPPASHYQLAKLALESGAHVLVEKPFTLDFETAQELLNLAEKKNKIICVNHMRYFDPTILFLKSKIEANHYSKIVSIDAHYSFDFDENRRYDSTSRWMTKLPGGPIFDILPHVLSEIESLIGDFAVKSINQSTNSDGFIDKLSILLVDNSSNNIYVNLLLNLNSYPLRNDIIIQCENALITIDLRNFVKVINRKSSLPNAVQRITGNLSISWQYVSSTLVAIFQFLRGKLDPYAGLDKIIRSLYTLDTSIASTALSATKYLQNIKLEGHLIASNTTDLKPADVLVTGGSGYLGRNLVFNLLKKGKSIRLMSHRPLDVSTIWPGYESKIQIVVGDIYDKEFVDSTILGIKTVIHLAAAMKGDWSYHLDTTVTGTKNILDACHKHNVSKLIYASTVNVYNANKYKNGVIVNEDFEYDPESKRRGNYSNAKQQAERYVLDFSYNNQLPTIIIRPGLIYGRSLNPLLGDLGIKLGNKMIACIGLGNRKLPLVHVDNVVNLFIEAYDYSQELLKPQIFNTVDDIYPSQREFVSAYNKYAPHKMLLIPIPFFMYSFSFKILDLIFNKVLKKETNLAYRLSSIKNTPVFDVSKAKKYFDWKPESTSFEQRMKEWIASQT